MNLRNIFSASNAEPFTATQIGGDHFRSSAVFLTQAHPKQTDGADVEAGTSLDQVHALPLPDDRILILNFREAQRISCQRSGPLPREIETHAGRRRHAAVMPGLLRALGHDLDRFGDSDATFDLRS